nr:MlaE family lipid ABC transporter permease subunit [Polymorphobacter sp.]
MTDATMTLDDAGEGARTLHLSGELTVASIGGVAPEMAAIQPDRDLNIDLGGLDRIDTTGAWLVHKLLRDWEKAGKSATLDHASPDAKRLIDQVALNDKPTKRRPPHGNRVVERLEVIGASVVRAAHTLGEFLAFLGQTLVALFQTIFERRPLRWNAVIHQMEVVGANALGIVGLLSFLVGIVLAQQGAVQLQQFGAEIFVVNLIGRSVIRELGILLTAIMVAGRSGSAFAAQIGSMKLNEEVDAMSSIGMSPIEVLVLPRVIAMVIMMTLLAFFGAVMAIIGGGLFCWVSLDIPPASFVQRIQDVTPLSDLVIGMIKAPIFGFIIAVTGCFQGMQVTGNAESVGARTTQSVVQSIFLVIVLDAFFAVFFTALGYV